VTKSVDKDSLPLDKPRRTPGHPTKSHIVKTNVGGKEKIIRFGEQGAETAGKPKAGESDRMKQKRASFKARHAKNIAKGKSSPAYWANKVKWAEGGAVKLAAGGGPALALIEQMRRSGGQAQEFDPVAASLRDSRSRPGRRPLMPLPQEQQAVPQAAPQEALPLPPVPPAVRPDENPPPEAPRNPVRFDEGNPLVARAVEMAERYRLPREIFLSLVQQESSFNPAAVSPRGAIGLGQLMPGTARELGVDPRDPLQNLEGSARYLRQQLDRFGDFPLALAAYNAGPRRVAEAGNAIPNIQETQNYVQSILRRAGVSGYAHGGLAELDQKYAEGGAVRAYDPDKVEQLAQSTAGDISDEEYDRRLLSRMERDTGRTTEPTWAEQRAAIGQAGRDAAQLAAETVLPQSPLDAALMVALGPGARTARLATSATLAALEPSEAEASGLLRRAASGAGQLFYRGIPRMRGQVDRISGLHAVERPERIAPSPHLEANTRNYAWASDNPAVASSYTHFGGAVVPLELTENPDAVFNAQGAPWREFFFQPSGRGKGAALNPEFREALDDPGVRSILVNSILDYGLESQNPRFIDWLSNRVYGRPANGLDIVERYGLERAGLTGNNLLIKDPSVVRYNLTGEPANFAKGGLAELDHKYAEGGAVNAQPTTYDPSAVDALVNQIEAGNV
jgi:soluble lytic murein transglycosylase-like protein